MSSKKSRRTARVSQSLRTYIPTLHSLLGSGTDSTHDDLAFEWPKAHEPELDCETSGTLIKMLRQTIDVGKSRISSDFTIRGLEQVVDADAESDVLYHLARSAVDRSNGEHHLIGVFGVEVVLYGFSAVLAEVLGSNLDEVRDGGLGAG